MILERYPKYLDGGKEIVIHKHYGVKGLTGEIDFWRDGILYDIKMSHEKKVDLNWIMQLMSYKGLMDREVNGFVVYNVMMGKMIEIPDVNLERCGKLVKFLQDI